MIQEATFQPYKAHGYAPAHIPAQRGILRSTTQLESLVASNGAEITVGGKVFVVEGVSTDRDISVGTFRSRKASHTGILCNQATVTGKPGAEVWSLISGKGREIAKFAVFNGKINTLD